MKKQSYTAYKDDILKKLKCTANELYKANGGGDIPQGLWRNGNPYDHILPIVAIGGESKDSIRRRAVEEYLHIKIETSYIEKVHPYVHHLNSSQLLCYMTFSPLLENGGKPKQELISLLAKLGLTISDSAVCSFEYTDSDKDKNKWYWNEEKEPEGTSFDFHIKDSKNELFFEIKMTEQGFGRGDSKEELARHQKKFEQLYEAKLSDCKVLKKRPNCEHFLRYYQLFRNVLRSTSPEKTVIFIVDENNPSTYKDIMQFKEEFLDESPNIRVVFWQEIKTLLNKRNRPFQFDCF